MNFMIKNIKEWSLLIRQRDGKCVKCNSTQDLHAHHLKHKSTNPELALILSNGITLCYRCHKKEHEKERPIRIRSNKPQRKTMQKRIDYLENLITQITNELNISNDKLKTYEKEINIKNKILKALYKVY